MDFLGFWKTAGIFWGFGSFQGFLKVFKLFEVF